MAAIDRTAKSGIKQGRIEARVPEEKRDYYQWAATLEGCSFTDYVIRALDKAAEDTVQRHQVMRLTVRETEAFAEALLNPGEPGERLRRYARRSKELLSE